MVPVACVLALAAAFAAGLPLPGLYVAIGAGLLAIGCGWIGFSRRDSPGWRRLCAAAAMTIGAIGVVLGAVRVAIVLVAIARIDRML